MHGEKAETEINRFMVVASNLVNFQITRFYKKYLAT